jgi:hypothetical protein
MNRRKRVIETGINPIFCVENYHSALNGVAGASTLRDYVWHHNPTKGPSSVWFYPKLTILLLKAQKPVIAHVDRDGTRR